MLWQRGNREFKPQRYANAVTAYEACQDSVISGYFEKSYKFNATLAKPSFEGLSRALLFSETFTRSSGNCLIAGGFYCRYGTADFGLGWILLQSRESHQEKSRHDVSKSGRQCGRSRDSSAIAGLFRVAAGDDLHSARAGGANRLRRFSALAVADLQRVLTPYQVFFWNCHFPYLRFYRAAFRPLGARRDPHGNGGGAVQGGVAGQG